MYIFVFIHSFFVPDVRRQMGWLWVSSGAVSSARKNNATRKCKGPSNRLIVWYAKGQYDIRAPRGAEAVVSSSS